MLAVQPDLLPPLPLLGLQPIEHLGTPCREVSVQSMPKIEVFRATMNGKRPNAIQPPN